MTDSLLALCVEIDPANSSLNLIEANIVEPFEARTTDCSNSMIGNQEVLLPSHEDVFSLC